MSKDTLNIRSFSWYNGTSNLSWVYVMERLARAFQNMGHNFYFLSTNGLGSGSDFSKEEMLKSMSALQEFGPNKKQIDLDFCYTVFPNLPKRFLSNSKAKACIYNYETDYFDPAWKRYYGAADYYFPSSDFSSEVFVKNGVPEDKVWTIPHGVDTDLFNPNIPPIKLKTKKKFRFVSVVAPHSRKNIDLMLNAYCKAFSKDDDVCLVLKTKVFKHSDGAFNEKTNPKGRKGFEIVLGDMFKDLYKKYGKDSMPEIEILSGFVPKVASIYNACNVHVSATSCEGFYMPGLEAMACGLINIAPRYSGHLDYMNDDNSLLVDTKLRKARRLEQYWHYDPRAVAGQASVEHMIELMRKSYTEYDQLIEKMRPHMEDTVRHFSWDRAAQMILDAINGDLPHYKKGTYNWWPK